MKVHHLYKEIKGSNNRLMGIDIHYNDGLDYKPIAIFAHGYKGFKDFGAWRLIGDQMAEKGIVFVRFNFSHNGTSIDKPLEFDDLEAFGENNYSKEINDLNLVIDYIYQLALSNEDWNESKISLIGHSRGGGMAILTANENKHVSSLITWAAIKSTFMGMPKGNDLARWKEEGVRYILNGRTKQQMPHYYQFYEDLIKNESRLSIENAAKSLKKPWFIVHGDIDEAVPLTDAVDLQELNVKARFMLIPNGTHTFSISHPWNKKSLSPQMQVVSDASIAFIKKIL